ncbi:hypothetical protein [Corallococcus llansteffanensis]|uniref:Uncharacterized protein n=1 Tax=Corallococcus llansteffanensis TaxID=2316731 RepID=A0A3A8QBX8_9BACT|nr:hypothetical protein [Corallococcus llansteffanensis]RKH66147.1 hypothetical protein D7V93_04770 [Corallococcus llansteffanensis]
MPRTLAAALALVAVLATTAAQSLEAAASKVYRGNDGQTVEVVTLEPRTSSEALIRVRGTDSEHDGITLKCTVKKLSRGADYVTRYHGDDYTVLVQRDGVHEASLPGAPSFRVKFNQEATDRFAAGEVLAAHQQQRESGQLAAFQKKPWPHLEKKYAARATEAVAALQKRCGVAPSFTFDWKSFGDEQMAELDVWAACAPLATQAGKHCASVKDARALVCRFGPTLGFERAGDTLTFTTTNKGAAEGPAFLDGKLSP